MRLFAEGNSVMDDQDGICRPAAAPLVSRCFTLAAAAVLAGGFHARKAAAQVADPRPPTVDTSNVQEVAPGVWVFRDHRTWLVPNIGIILGNDAALVVDTGLGPANGERVLDLARRLAGNRRLLLTLTHFHPEHGYGAQAFRPDATILYNRAQREELDAKGALDGAEIVMPHTVYDGPSAEIDLGGRKVELRTWGTAHTRGDQIVFLPPERILFAGDLIEERSFPIFPWFPPQDQEIDDARWVGILNGFRGFDPAVVVPGHGDMGGIQIAMNLAAHIEDVGRQVRALRKQGQAPGQIVAEIKPKIIAAYPTWEHPGLIDWELQCFAAQPA